MATFLWKRRRRLTVGVTLLLVLVAVLVKSRSEPPALAVSGGDAYVVLPVVDTNPDPNIIETTITAEPAAVFRPALQLRTGGEARAVPRCQAF